jgi:ABC-type cobalt transport system substrate-binding protein
MKVQSSTFKVQCFFIIFLLFTIPCSLFTAVVFASEKWQGVDESVVEKVAKEHGREAMKPLINTDQGDLLLFVFLLAGTIGGFIAGYSWKKLIERKTPEQEHCEETGLSKAVKREGKR